MVKTVIAFDLYGTILSPASIATQLERLYGKDKAASIAAQARIYQLEYSWRVSSMQGGSLRGKAYKNFSDLTRWSFKHAASEAGVSMSQADEDAVLDAYNGLDTFEDASTGLAALSESKDVDGYIFSNGTMSMLTSSISTSPGLAQSSTAFPADKVVSVDSIGVFKPDPRAYGLMQETAQKANPDMMDIWLVSSNPFDIVGAANAGWKTAWVGRGKQWVDGLGAGAGLNPTVIVQGVDEAVAHIYDN